MLPSSSHVSAEFEYYEKIANEVLKYEVLMKKDVKLNHQDQKNLKHAYQELAKTFYLTNASSGYKLLQHLVKFCIGLICMKVRKDVYQSEYGVLSTCPSWVQALDKPLGLMQNVYKQLRKSAKPKIATSLFSSELLAAIKRELHNSAFELRSDLLLKRESVRNHALSLELPVSNIFYIWKNMYKVSVLKLDYLLEAGDNTDNVHHSVRLTKIEKNILDLGLLYDMKVGVVKKSSFLINEKLNVMLLLYKLMVAAKEKYFSYVAQKNGARTGTATICQSRANVNESNNGNLNYNENFNAQNLESYIKMRNESSETLEMWALVYLEYSRRGFDASFVLLQKRWYEMKSLTKKLLEPSTSKNNQIPHLLMIAMAKRFPYIIADELPSWFALVRNGQIYTDSNISALPEEWKKMRLDVKENVNVNDILEELYEENQVDVQVIETKLDVIDVDSDSESDVNNYSEIDYSNQFLNKDTTMPQVIQENITESQIERILAQKKLGNADNFNIKTTIILEEDFDIDKELQMFEKKHSNSASTHNAVGNEISAVKEFQNIDTEMNDRVVNVSSGSEDDTPLFNLKKNAYNDDDDEDLNSDDLERNIENSEETEEFIIDKKLILLPQVVLTPIEKTSVWRKYSCNNVMQCSQKASKMSDANEIDFKLSKSRQYMAPQVISQSDPIMTHSNNENRNTEKDNEIREINKNKALKSQNKNIRKQMQNKRKFLMRHLKLSKTSYSKEFWSERNVNLLEQCKPVSVTLNRVMRVAKKVELADIDEIRRINKTLLTAQVAPMTHTHRDERTQYSSIERIQQNNVDEENAKETFNSSSNSKTNPVIVNEEMRNMFRKIVVKKYTSNPLNTSNYKKPTTEAEIKWLKNNIIKQICKMLDILVNRNCKIPLTQRKPRNMKQDGQDIDKDNSKEDLALNSIDEWQRQKTYTRKYFHIKPVSDVINKDNKKDDHKKEDKQISTETKQYDSDDGNLVIDEDINIENKAINEFNKPLKDMAKDMSMKNEINGISIDNEMIEKNIVKPEINNEMMEINNGILLNNEMIETNNGITEINNDISINTGLSINNDTNKTDLEMSRDDYINLIIVSSDDDDDDAKLNINDTTKLNENVIKSSNNGIPVPELVTISTNSSQNSTVDMNDHDVINLLSKVAYNIQSKNQNVQTIPSNVSDPPPLQFIGNAKSQNKINDISLHQQSLNSPNTTYYLIKVPSEMTPSNSFPEMTPLDSFPMPVIQSVESLSSEEKVVITKTNQTPSPIIYNDILKNYESPGSLRSLLTNTNIINKDLKRVFPVSLNEKRCKAKPPLSYKRKEKNQRNTGQSPFNR